MGGMFYVKRQVVSKTVNSELTLREAQQNFALVLTAALTGHRRGFIQPHVSVSYVSFSISYSQ